MKKILRISLVASGSLIFSVGLIVQLKELWRQQQENKTDHLLKQVRQSVGQQKIITGSWIESQAEPFTRENRQLFVNYGGLTCTENGTVQQYHFTVDHQSGVLLELTAIQR